MEMEPDHQVEDNAQAGKRKRSPGAISYNDLNGALPDTMTHTREVLYHGQTPEITKRQRIAARTTDPALTAVTAFGTTAHKFPNPPFPVEVVHHILSFMDPFSLARLMSVNKYFHSLLDPARSTVGLPDQNPKLTWTAEKLWTHARKAHMPGMPHPLKLLKELDMFKLVYGKRCQECHAPPKSQHSTTSMEPWTQGPGPNGVRTIWPFRQRLCYACLKASTIKDTDLLQDGLSQLEVGLLCASFTPSLHYVMSVTLTQTRVPVKITKLYLRKHLENLIRDAPSPYSSDNRLFQSWSEEADALRQEASTDTIRLEAWELSRMVQSNASLTQINFRSRSSASGSSVHSDNLTKSHFTTSSSGIKQALSSHSGLASSLMLSSLTRNIAGFPSFSQNKEKPAEHHIPPSHTKQAPALSQTGHMLSNDNDLGSSYGSLDVQRLRYEKGLEIQRRCLNFVPPISIDVLRDCPAYSAALQSLMPLDENTWTRLRGQLELESRRSPSYARAERLMQQFNNHDSASTHRAVTPFIELTIPDLREQARRPVREKLYDFAREYVHRRYADGFGQSHSSAPQFAADVLVYVRERFYQNQAEEDAAFAAFGEPVPDEGPSGIRTRTLKLEHMRYVFESSIKPFTEFVRKDLFLCSGCDNKGKSTTSRYFAFEAIIQHFASLHTQDFSRGTAVVHWKSDWPAQPPFEPQPGRGSDHATSSDLLASSRIYTAIPDLQPGDHLGGMHDSAGAGQMVPIDHHVHPFDTIRAAVNDDEIMCNATSGYDVNNVHSQYRLRSVEPPQYRSEDLGLRGSVSEYRAPTGPPSRGPPNIVAGPSTDPGSSYRSSVQQVFARNIYDERGRLLQYSNALVSEAESRHATTIQQAPSLLDARWFYPGQRSSGNEFGTSQVPHHRHGLEMETMPGAQRQSDRHGAEHPTVNLEHRRFELLPEQSRALVGHQLQATYDKKNLSYNVTQSPTRNEADHFLDSVDAERNIDQAVVVSRSFSAGIASRLSPSNNVNLGRVMPEHVIAPEPSLYLRRNQEYDVSNPPPRYIASTSESHSAHHGDEVQRDRIYQPGDGRGYDYSSASYQPQQDEQPINPVTHAYISLQTGPDMGTDMAEGVDRHERQLPSSHNNNQSGRNMRIDDFGSQRIVYRENMVAQQHYNHDDPRAAQIRHHRLTYEGQEVFWDPIAGNYYIERPIQVRHRQPLEDEHQIIRGREAEWDPPPTHPRYSRDPRNYDRENRQ